MLLRRCLIARRYCCFIFDAYYAAMLPLIICAADFIASILLLR